jgi:hypothetical protein
MALQVPRDLIFDPFHGGDPGPEIWRILHEVDIRQQLEVVKVVISTQIGVAEARLEGLKRLATVIETLPG